MIVRDLMTSPPHTCRPDTNLAAVTQLMWDHDCGLVPVVDDDGRVAGVVTDRDICVASSTRRLSPDRLVASQVMSADVQACLPDDGVNGALAMMKEFQVHRVPVVDALGRLQGILSINDIARAVGKKGAPSAAAVVSTLSGICAPRPMAAAAALESASPLAASR